MTTATPHSPQHMLQSSTTFFLSHASGPPRAAVGLAPDDGLPDAPASTLTLDLRDVPITASPWPALPQRPAATTPHEPPSPTPRPPLSHPPPATPVRPATPQEAG